MIEDGRAIEEINEYIDTRIFTSDMTFRGWFGTPNSNNITVLDSGVWKSHMNSELIPAHAFDEGLAHGIGSFLLENNYLNVVDFGCGWTAYTVKYLRKMGLSCTGYDGDHLLETNGCHQLNLAQKDLLLPVYDFLISLEVAEHIPLELESNFISNCDRSNKYGIIISWSPPEGGFSHVNEKMVGEVIPIFTELGYEYDHDTTLRLRESVICHWYRDRLMVFRR